VRLSKKYGIPTEYTSFLADERMTAEKLKERTLGARDQAEEGLKFETGSWGVAQSRNSAASRGSAQAPAAASVPGYSYGGGYGGGYAGSTPADITLGGALPSATVAGKVAANQRVGGTYQDSKDRTVVVANVQNVARRTFYQRGSFWEDADLKPGQTMVQIKQFSDAHFKLMKAYPKLAQYSSLGNVRAILANNQAVEIGPEGQEKLSEKELKNLTLDEPKK
jgi:hypothetical protein